jgi:hypothetical protein
MRNKVVFSLVILCCLFIATSLSAQATRTWVSGVGDDVNPCSRTAPCKTWAGAISKTAVCGEIDALDPGGFGAVVITKSITLDGEGTMASILNTSTNGITVNITASDYCNTVILRNISINGSGGSSGVGALGLTGIRLLGSQAVKLHIEHLSIQHQLRGIDIAPTVANNNVFMDHVDIRHTTVHGIDVHPTAGQQVKLSFENVRSRQSAGDGLRLANDVRGTISNSQFQGNNNGVNVVASSVLVSLVRSILSQNTATGLINGSTATSLIDGCSITNNNTGILNNTGGTVFGFANNMIAGNGAGGDVSGTAVSTAGHP